MGTTTNPDSGRATLNVSLTQELARFVEGQVKGGLYSTASEVVREALRMLSEREQMRALRREEMRKKVQAGVDQLDRGEGLDGDAVFDEIERDIDDLESRQGKT
ncbi:MAG: type II toxin-antitoxin system ParD family antitoxin [Planctomycetota bacterium]